MENTSIRGRYSLSTSNLTSPIAESTCLNGTNSHAKFNWGEGTISSRSRNNHNHTANKNTSISKNLNGTPPKIAMSPTSRIDPRTYVDINSNGLASRIVKYHDYSTRFNRSLSMGNLYNKPGQFPVVHLKKNEQQYKAKKSRNLSMTRIAAPEKSVFHGNTLSSILRSGSIVALQKSDEEISRENRPILHPPPTENEMAPTRSVLEVLKEISRKRINSDELDGTELIKKQCKEPEFDTMPYNGQNSQSKRQREVSTSVASNLQISPEQQVVKKRMCSYNNDIMSSLSSSMLSVNKKKLIEIQSQKRTASDLVTGNKSATSSDIESSRSEKQRCMGSFELENLAAPSNKYTPISPLPNTPSTGSSDELDKYKGGIVSRRASEPVISSTKPKLTLFNKDYDAVPTKVRNDITESREDGELCGIQFVKPKKSSSLSSGVTRLLEKTKESKLALMLSALKGELNEEDEIDAPLKMQQLKPVEITVSAPTSSTPSAPSVNTGISFGTITPSTTVTPTPETISKTVAVSSVTIPTAVKSGLQFNPPTVTAPSASNELKISATTVVASTSSNPEAVSLPAITTSASILSISSTATSIPSLSGFSFGLISTPSLTTTTSAVSTSQPIVPQVPVAMSQSTANLPVTTTAMKPFEFGVTSTSAVAPDYTFGVKNAVSLSAPVNQPPSRNSVFGIASTTASKPTDTSLIFGQIATAAQPTMSFGSLAASNANHTTNSLTTAISTPQTTSAPTFDFGTVKSSWNPSAVAQAPANAVPNLGLFGGVATSTSIPESTASLTTTTSAGGFSFSGSTSTEAPKAFSNLISSTTIPSNLNATFSLSTNKAPDTQTNSSNAFTFGASAMTNPAQPPMFSSTTSVKPSNSFSFNAPPPSTPLKPSFSFPSTVKPAVPTTTIGNSIGGFSFNAPAANSLSTPDPNRNIFPTKPTFSFSEPAVKPNNLFATTKTQNSAFAFGSPSGANNQTTTATAPNTILFGGASTASSSVSIFGAPSATVAPSQQQSSTFSFGSSPNNPTAENKPAGGFVFGSSSSIGSNASKPATDLNKTIVFGDGSTTITPAPPQSTNLFGGNNTTNNGSVGATEGKMFSFGGAASAGSNSTFGASHSTINQSSTFSFGQTTLANPASAQNVNLFAPQSTGGATSTMMTTGDRPIKKAMRRLNKT